MSSDTICIRNFPLKCRIGVSAGERRVKQKVYLTLLLHADLGRAGASDDLADTVDYDTLLTRLSEKAGSGRYHLLESLAELIASTCLAEGRVQAVNVTVEKRGVLPAPVSVQIYRSGTIRRKKKR